MKLILTCGGTGGHITPALAIADTVKENDPRAEILFVGSERGMERELVGRAGYPMLTLPVEGLIRAPTLANLRVLRNAVRAVRGAEDILRDFRPQAVVGTGGYACYPTLRAAAKMGIPTAVHESNAVPGLAVRRLGRHVDRVWLGFAAAAVRLPKGTDTLVVGNPLPRRKATVGACKLPAGCRKMLLSFGGSLGAGVLNDAVLALMIAERERTDIYHLHATGKREYERFMGGMRAAGLAGKRHLEVLPFIEDMPERMAAADLVICRAGAMSISELAAGGKAAVLIPSPNVTGNHQYLNAKTLADAGAALLLGEAGLKELLPMEALTLLDASERRTALSRAIESFARPQANRLILEDLHRLIKE